jgi:hypothetical protein
VLQEHEDHGQEHHIYTAMPIQDCGTQTTFTCNDALANKIERRLRKNEIHAKVKSPVRKRTVFGENTLTITPPMNPRSTVFRGEHANHYTTDETTVTPKYGRLWVHRWCNG